MEWAIEECAKTRLPVGASMCIGPEGDMHGVSAAECAIRMARAGAKIGNFISISICISITLVKCVSTQTMSVQVQRYRFNSDIRIFPILSEHKLTSRIPWEPSLTNHFYFTDRIVQANPVSTS